MIEKRENKLTKFGIKPPGSNIVTSPSPSWARKPNCHEKHRAVQIVLVTLSPKVTISEF